MSHRLRPFPAKFRHENSHDRRPELNSSVADLSSNIITFQIRAGIYGSILLRKTQLSHVLKLGARVANDVVELSYSVDGQEIASDRGISIDVDAVGELSAQGQILIHVEGILLGMGDVNWTAIGTPPGIAVPEKDTVVSEKMVQGDQVLSVLLPEHSQQEYQLRIGKDGPGFSFSVRVNRKVPSV